ncbi:hypothetical protein E2C01_036870 [Portunus trituberculatus]|uniref:Uncharacterized protein n=1 Tax=Portunus trituberculatus TaxID=210409 RepID=A0A5B7F6L5_PORTR|nr:hypothetical protein [Portunus trituberculatus]
MRRDSPLPIIPVSTEHTQGRRASIPLSSGAPRWLPRPGASCQSSLQRQSQNEATHRSKQNSVTSITVHKALSKTRFPGCRLVTGSLLHHSSLFPATRE